MLCTSLQRLYKTLGQLPNWVVALVDISYMMGNYPEWYMNMASTGVTTTTCHVRNTPRHPQTHRKQPLQWPPLATSTTSHVTHKHVNNDHCTHHHHSPCPQHPTSPANALMTTSAATTTLQTCRLTPKQINDDYCAHHHSLNPHQWPRLRLPPRCKYATSPTTSWICHVAHLCQWQYTRPPTMLPTQHITTSKHTNSWPSALMTT